jgi:arsenite oxidase small subunit
MASHQETTGPQEHAPLDEAPRGPIISRRNFIAGLGAASGAVVVGVAMRGASPGAAALGVVAPDPAKPDFTFEQEAVPAVVTSYPRARVASLSGLVVNEPVDFMYPTVQTAASLFKLGKPVAGGVGPDGDIVALNTDCTHMGCPLRGLFKPEHGILGPCACHFTTFDVAKRGQVVIGQATENLPQVLLDIDGDDIYAVGTLGLAYGFRDNLADAPLVEGL